MNSSLRFIATGICVPQRIVTNEEIHKNINSTIDPSWVEETLGIKQRHIVDDEIMTSDLAARAARAALSQADVPPESIDLVILATSSPDKVAPATACLVQGKAGLSNAVAFDISAVCSGFLFALTAAAALLHSRSHHRALVIGADIFSRVTDWERRDCVFFGDGAGAALVEAAPEESSALFDAELFTDSNGRNAFAIEGFQNGFLMDGPAVFSAAAKAVPACIDRLLARNGMSSRDVDIVIPHQPSRSLLREIAHRAGIPFERFQLSMSRYANTVAATIPIALHEAIETGRLSHGDRVLFAAAGAGFTAGAAIHHWS